MHGDNHLPLNGVLLHHSMLISAAFQRYESYREDRMIRIHRDRRSWGNRLLWGSGYRDWVRNFLSMHTLSNDWVECIRSKLSSCVQA